MGLSVSLIGHTTKDFDLIAAYAQVRNLRASCGEEAVGQLRGIQERMLGSCAAAVRTNIPFSRAACAETHQPQTRTLPASPCRALTPPGQCIETRGVCAAPAKTPPRGDG